MIVEFASDLNPGLTKSVGDSLLDEKIGGSVHIVLGINESFRGQNRSNLHLDLVMLSPTSQSIQNKIKKLVSWDNTELACL